MLLLTFTSCSAKRFATEYIEPDAEEQDYWRRVEECGFKFPKPKQKTVSP